MRIGLKTWRKAAGGLAAALLAAAGFAVSAAALSITTAAITFSDVNLNGMDQTVNGSTSAWRVDAAGESGGWNLTVSSTDFDNGSGKTIAVANFEIRLMDSSIAWVSGDSVNLPVSTQTTFVSLSGSPLKIASAAVSEGDGVYDMTPDFRLTIPAETFAGAYGATVTVSITTGP